MIDLSGYGFAVFDCDGVILDSNNLKTEAFSRSLEGEPAEAVAKLLAYHEQHAGLSRYHKFQLFYEQIRPVDNAEALIDTALARFSDIAKRGLLACRYVPGSVDFILKARRAGLRLFVASGSDQDELVNVFKSRQINGYFERILGSPTPKLENTRLIASLTASSGKGLFFGDARADLEAADATGMDFVFVKGCSTWKEGAAEIKARGSLEIDDFTQQV